MRSIIAFAGVGIGIVTMAIAILFVFISNAVLKNGESRPRLSGPYEQALKVETVTDGLSFPTSMEFIDNENIPLTVVSYL